MVSIYKYLFFSLCLNQNPLGVTILLHPLESLSSCFFLDKTQRKLLPTWNRFSCRRREPGAAAAAAAAAHLFIQLSRQDSNKKYYTC